MASIHWSTKGPPMSRQFCTPCTQISLTSAGQAEHTDSAFVLSPQAPTANPNPSSNPRMIFVCPIALLPVGLVEASEPHPRGDAKGSQTFSDDSSLLQGMQTLQSWSSPQPTSSRTLAGITLSRVGERAVPRARPGSVRSQLTADVASYILAFITKPRKTMSYALPGIAALLAGLLPILVALDVVVVSPDRIHAPPLAWAPC